MFPSWIYSYNRLTGIIIFEFSGLSWSLDHFNVHVLHRHNARRSKQLRGDSSPVKFRVSICFSHKGNINFQLPSIVNGLSELVDL